MAHNHQVPGSNPGLAPNRHVSEAPADRWGFFFGDLHQRSPGATDSTPAVGQETIAVSDQDNKPPSVSDLLVELMRQQSDGFKESRDAIKAVGETISRMDTDVALVKQNMDQLNGLPSRVANLETRREVQQQTLLDFERRITANTHNVSSLLTDTNRRKGLEGPLGKVVMVAAGALVTALVVAVLAAIGIRPAKGADLRTDDVANKQCWAVPAKPGPKYLNL